MDGNRRSAECGVQNAENGRPAIPHSEFRIQHSPRAAHHYVLVSAFVVALCMPMAGMVLRLAPQRALTENRKLADFPSLALGRHDFRQYLRQVQTYLGDQFGFRAELIHWYHIVKTRWLGVSSSEQVVIGKKGWLFYAGDQALSDFRCIAPFTQAELESWRRLLERREEWLRRRGIRYLVVIAPNSHTIYPEYLPDWATRLHQKSRLDQLIAHLRANSRIQILDVRPALLEGKRRGRLYMRTDTHWNDHGAFIAYEQIMGGLGRWFPALESQTIGDYNVTSIPVPGGDLAALVDAQDIFREERIRLVPRLPARAKREVIQAQGTSSDPYILSLTVSRVDRPDPWASRPGAGLPRAVMIHDSFGIGLIPFLAEHFSRTLYVSVTLHHYFPAQLIDKERPDVVIEESIERSLMALPNESLDALSAD